MKRHPALSLAVLAVVLALAACSSTPKQDPVPITESGGSKPVAETPKTPNAGDTKPIVTVKPEGGETFNPIKEFSVYFDLDQYTVDDKHIPLVRRHADYIKKNPAKRVSIQGNTDERGSREYNLSLGQKRAEAVKKLLVTEGAREAQIEAVSLGEEKPQDAGHDESAWAKNRRSDITYPQ